MARDGRQRPFLLAWLLANQGLAFLRAPHALRWRLETFGLYMPSLPETRPWWRINQRAAVALLAQFPSYLLWLEQMEALRHQKSSAQSRTLALPTRAQAESWLAQAEDE